MSESNPLLEVVQEVRRGARYQAISPDLVERISLQELKKGGNFKETVKAVRSRLHQAGGAYQDKPIPYLRLGEELNLLPREPQAPDLQAFCRRVMSLHASTRERLPVVERIFRETLAGISPIRSVLDLACGLNPLALPWMPLAQDAPYTACDIYADMVDFLGVFLRHVDREGGAQVCDLLAGMPTRPVHLALLLKSIPCLEQLDKTIGGRLLEDAPAEFILVSFPSASLGGQGKGMRKNYAAHFEQLVSGKNWPVERFDFPGELVFLINKIRRVTLMMDETFIDKFVEEILTSRKYRDLDLPAETVRSLLGQELPRHKSEKDALKAVRQKLHNIVAPYLGDPDFAHAGIAMQDAFRSNDPLAVQRFCTSILVTHISSLERMPFILGFFPQLWEVTGLPTSLLDLACGLNPFALPWMGLPKDTVYQASDLNGARVGLINSFFGLYGQRGQAEKRDILLSPPQEEADVALFLKEAHRFEQRQHGCNRPFWQALRVEWLLVSLPTESLSKRHSLIEGHRRLVYNTIAGLDWPVTEVEFPGEMVFCIRKAKSKA